MQLDKLGEFGLIDLIQIPSYAPEQVILSRGDDCAVLSYNETQYQVLSCDLLVEDVHFIRKKMTPQQLGYKSVAVNLSDVAAMGGKPVHLLLSLALPPDYMVEEWQGFYEGVDAICRKYNVNVIGGDTTSSVDKLTINVTVLGFVEKQHLHLRSHAVPGDVVFVTGSLGGSRAGLELIQNDIAELEPSHRDVLVQCHCKPEPCCDEIAVLNRLAGDALHALNDISDGFLSECREIAQASGVALIVQPDAVPVNRSCAALAQMRDADALQWAITGGEDYQLVGTMEAEQAEEICAKYEAETGKQLTIVGRIEAGSGVYLLQNGQPQAVNQYGYDHFENYDFETDSAEHDDHGDHDARDDNIKITDLEQIIQQQLTVLAEQEEQHRIYRHDFNNHLACLSGLLQCGETEQALEYLQQMIAAVPQPVQREYSKRTVLNVLLQQKVQQAKQRGMDVQIQCEDGLLDFMSDYDLCTLLGNLLDNGIEHGTSLENYRAVDDIWLYLDIIRRWDGTVLLRMENSCVQPPTVQNGCLTTQKTEPELHGKGIAQIQRITGRYGGQFCWQYDAAQKKFVTECQFKNSP